MFDIIRRYLEHLGYEVQHVQNYTDIDDKIINRAKAEGLDARKLTDDLIENWSREVIALNLLPAKIYPRATQEVPEIITMIEGLIERGHAYEVDGDVYFRVRTFPEYGKLSGRDVDELRAGARIEVDERKGKIRSTSRSGRPRPGGRAGRARGARAAGWHIECSAMSIPPRWALDIRGWLRPDLPHHEIAQSEAYSGESRSRATGSCRHFGSARKMSSRSAT